jgi:hypothetical protein
MDLRSEIRLLQSLGPRLTGSKSHRELVAHVASKLDLLGLAVQHDGYKFPKWDAPRDRDRLKLSVDGNELQISAAFPYSGTTGPGSVVGRLQLVSRALNNWSMAQGAIAVFEVPHSAVEWNLLFRSWDDSNHEPFLNPVVSAGLFGPDLKAARDAGVLAVVAVWRGLSAEGAERQYLPFTQPYHDLPAIWVAGDSGEALLSAATLGKEARLVLDATLTPDCATETVWAVSPGANASETILVVTHSDGTNSVEENGHIALLELAQDAVDQPHQRTIVYVYTTGHLRIPSISPDGKQQATSAWLEAHRDLWAGASGHARAVAGLAIEHLGARRLFDEETAKMHEAAGCPEPELLYATTRELRDLLLANWSGAYLTRTEVTAPGPSILFGELEPLYQRQIPGISLVTAPQYLLAEREGDFVDIDVMRRQIDSFRRLQRVLDTTPTAKLGTVKITSQQSTADAVQALPTVKASYSISDVIKSPA